MDKLMLWVKKYVTLCGVLMICSFFMCLFFDPTRKLNLVTYFGQCLLLALIALASLAVYYSLVSNEAEKAFLQVQQIADRLVHIAM
jgi:hypothetical protein